MKKRHKKKTESAKSAKPTKLPTSPKSPARTLPTPAPPLNGDRMGIYTEYLEKNLSFEDLHRERKKQLAKIAKLRGNRDVLVYAADLNKSKAPTGIIYEDELPFNDQLSNLKGSAIDLIIETPGGQAEVVEDFVRDLRAKYEDIGVIVPGWAKSAGTILAMAGDEILMEQSSALGPIDAQIGWQGRQFSAEALLDYFEKIKKDSDEGKPLNRAYIPMLQGISPGDLQHAENALEFARVLVTDWLKNYKFRNWSKHSSTGADVTVEDREQRAKEIADKLCSHKRWLTHNRSIRIADLENMRLKITDYSKTPDLADAIRRYHVLLQMTFSTSTVYKIFETTKTHLLRVQAPAAPATAPQPPQIQEAENLMLDLECPHCSFGIPLQARLKASVPRVAERIQFPRNNKIRCPNCKNELDITSVRRDLEMQSGKSIVS